MNKSLKKVLKKENLLKKYSTNLNFTKKYTKENYKSLKKVKNHNNNKNCPLCSN